MMREENDLLRLSRRDSGGSWKYFLLICVMIATLASAGSVFQTIIKFKNIPFPWDPAGHATEGLIIARDLKAGDIISLIGDTYRQGWWPFFHSWLLAPAFIIFGKTYAAARGVSLFCFVLAVLLIYWVGFRIDSKKGHWVGLITVYLVLTSLPFLVLSAMCMSEIPGVFMTFLTFLVYLRAVKNQSSFLFVCASVLMALTLFTKWHHGIFAASAVLLTQVTSQRKIITRSNLSLFLPFLLIMLGWFIYPRHIASFYGHSTFQPHYYKFLSLENWLYYPNSVLKIYHSSLPIAALVVVAFIFTFTRIKNPAIRVLIIHVLVGIILMTIKLDNRHRYIISIVPSIWILGSSQIVEMAYYLKNRLKDRKLKIALASCLIVLAAVVSSFSVPRTYKSYPDLLLGINYWGDERPKKAYEFVADNVGRHDHLAVFGSWDYYNSLNSQAIRWHIEVNRDRNWMETRFKKKRARFFFSQLLKRWDRQSFNDFVRFLEDKDVRVEEYHLLSFLKTLDQGAYQGYRERIRINPFSDKIIDINLLDSQTTCLIVILNEEEKELNGFAERYFLNQKAWQKFNEERFIDLGVKITLYERKTAAKARTPS